MSQDQQNTSVEIITADHCYSGWVKTRGRRLADMLSDSTTDVFQMHEVRISTEGACSRDVRCKQILLKKSRILLAIPTGSYEAPTGRLHKYVAKDQYPAMITLPGRVLSCVVHLPARAIPRMLLEEDVVLPGFIGVTNVTVHSSTDAFAPSQCDVAIIRRQAIESVQSIARPLPKPEGKALEGSVTSGHLDPAWSRQV